MKGKILKLNKYYMPIGVSDWREVIKNMCSGAVYPLDISYATDENGAAIKDEVESCEPIKTWDEWCKLEVRPYDEYIRSVNKVVRMPVVVVCADYNKVRWGKVMFPTKRNIWARDNFTCCYSGKKLTRDELSIDHIMPVSRGGENTWMNLVTCDRELNRKKADRTPEEWGVKLKAKPFIPKSHALVFNNARPEWGKFIPE